MLFGTPLAPFGHFWKSRGGHFAESCALLGSWGGLATAPPDAPALARRPFRKIPSETATHAIYLFAFGVLGGPPRSPTGGPRPREEAIQQSPKRNSHTCYIYIYIIVCIWGPRGSQEGTTRDAKGKQREPKDIQREPTGSQQGSKRDPKGIQMDQTGSQKDRGVTKGIQREPSA